jgi:endonuclease III
MMHVFICSTVVHGVGPTRWFWESNLICGMSSIKKVSRQDREFGMLVCLILSAATPDDHCISATISLWESGLLEPSVLKETDFESIKKCIAITGIQNKRAIFLKELA